ncbi:MAG: queuosine precursor transporter [Bacteroidales bacterium]
MNEKLTGRSNVSVLFMVLTTLFVVCLISANLLETKLITFFGITTTAGLIIFPVSYIVNDCITEVWGFKKARLVIWLGFAMNLFVVLLGKIASIIPAAEYWAGGEHFNYIFNFLPRITIASLMAFLVGSFLNSLVMSKMKIKSKGKNFSLRAVISTIIGEFADSIIFFPIAFGGIITIEQLIKLMLVQVVLKTSYEIIILPVTNIFVKWVKKYEKVDTFDENISYNIFKINDL